MVPRRRYTSYGKVKKPNVSYFHIFSSIFYILNDCEHLGKFDAKSDTIVFLGYATNSKAYRVYNMRTRTIMESINVVIDDSCDFLSFQRKKLYLACCNTQQNRIWF